MIYDGDCVVYMYIVTTEITTQEIFLLLSQDCESTRVIVSCDLLVISRLPSWHIVVVQCGED